MSRKRGEMSNRIVKTKKGLSTIVLTLIIVACSLILIGLIWGPVRTLIRGQTETMKIQNQFFNERMSIVSVYFEEPYVNITLRKPSGQIKTSTYNVTSYSYQQGMDADLYSIVDLSGSMRQCLGITRTQCLNTLLGSWSNPVCDSLLKSAETNCLSFSGTWNDKLTATQNANSEMITNLLDSGDTKIGLIGYRHIVVEADSLNLTDDILLLNATMNSWNATSMTCICCGINSAALRLSQQSSSEKLKSIIVMSDGEANVQCAQQGTGNAKTDAIKAACDANTSLNNLLIYTVGVQGADEITLTNISNCGNGRYFNVTNTSELIGIYESIAEDIEQRYQSISALTYLYATFYNGTDSTKEKIFNIPEILETKTYNFNLYGKLSGEIIRIEIYPVVVNSQNKEVIGPVMEVWTKKS